MPEQRSTGTFAGFLNRWLLFAVFVQMIAEKLGAVSPYLQWFFVAGRILSRTRNLDGAGGAGVEEAKRL